LIDGLVQTFLAPTFPLEFFPIGQAPQVIDQPAPVDQEGPAGLANHLREQREYRFTFLALTQSAPAFHLFRPVFK
jgi:hypothetical protein